MHLPATGRNGDIDAMSRIVESVAAFGRGVRVGKWRLRLVVRRRVGSPMRTTPLPRDSVAVGRARPPAATIHRWRWQAAALITAANIAIASSALASQPSEALPNPADVARMCQSATREQAARALRDAAAMFDISESSFFVQKGLDRAALLHALRPCALHVGDPLRIEFLQYVHHIGHINGDLDAATQLLAEWDAARLSGIGVAWQAPAHIDLTLRYQSAHLDTWLGDVDRSQQALQRLFNDVLDDVTQRRPSARERLQALIKQLSGARVWHEQIAAFAQRVADQFGPDDDLSARALLAASFSLRVMGHADRSAQLGERAMQIARGLDPLNERLLASAASQLGLARLAQGRLLEGKPLLEFARDESTRLAPPGELSRAWVWYSTAHAYTLLGEYDDAIRDYERAIAIINERPVPADDPDRYDLDRRVVRVWIGYVHALAGRDQQALRFFDDAMSLPRMWQPYDPWLHATYPEYARLLVKAGRFADAQRLLAMAERAAFNSTGPESSMHGLVAAGRGLAAARGGDAARAVPTPLASDEHFATALAILLNDASGYELADAWFTLGEAWDSAPGRDVATIFALKMGASVLSSARARASEGVSGEVAVGGYLRPLRRLVDLLAKKGRIDEWTAIREQIGQEEQYAFVRRSPRAQISRRLGRSEGSAAAEPLPWNSAERRIFPAVAEATRASQHHRKVVQAELARFFSGFMLFRGAAVPFPPDWDRSVSESRQSASALLASLHDLDRAAAALAGARVGYADTAGTVSKTRRPLETGLSAHVKFALGRDDISVTIDTPKRRRILVLPTAQDVVAQSIAAFRSVLRRPDLDPLPAAQRLWREVLEPVWHAVPEVRGGRVRFDVENTPLRYIPIAALHDGKRYLAERIIVVQGAAPAPGERQKSRGKSGQLRLATIGATAHDGEPELASVPAELAAVRAAWSQGERATLAIAEARREDALATIRGAPDVLHIAAHYRYRPGSETRSALLLSGSDRLPMSELRMERFDNIRLITLSACDSALDFADGAEVSGLSRTLIENGAHAVLGTLWAVSDPATAEWMARFYRTWLAAQATMSKVDAISKVHRAFIRGNVRGGIKGETDWSHPFFWAGYVLAGEP